MSTNDTLTPQEATCIAHNAYFALKDWMTGSPTIGVETRANVKKMVVGDGRGAAAVSGASANTSLANTALKGARLDRVFSGETAGVSTGFGYVLSFSRGGSRQVVVATRGTRAEQGKADLLTDLHGSLTSFGDYGRVHTGFKNTFDSVRNGLARDDSRIMDADVVHCVGHSLGGAVATLVASHFAARGKAVKLYTFGCPRVGAYGAEKAMESRLGKANVYRVSHDLDPVTMVGPFPFGHLNGAASDENNMMVVSPTGKLLSVANHDMNEYVRSVGAPDMNWQAVRALGGAVDHDNAVVARWLLRSSDEPGWLLQGAAKGLTYLMKAFSHFLKGAGCVGVEGMTALDLFSASLAAGIERFADRNPELMECVLHAARWARIVVKSIAQVTASVIRGILDAMMRVLRPLAMQSVVLAGSGMAMPLVIASANALSGSVIA